MAMVPVKASTTARTGPHDPRDRRVPAVVVSILTEIWIIAPCDWTVFEVVSVIVDTTPREGAR
jgi:hypothetical protein